MTIHLLKTPPRRGDIVFVSLDPFVGHEQSGHRPVLVVSPESFNRLFKLMLVCPITSTVRGHGFEVQLPSEMKTVGVILCQQARTLDFLKRKTRFVEAAPPKIIEEVLAKMKTLVV